MVKKMKTDSKSEITHPPTTGSDTEHLSVGQTEAALRESEYRFEDIFQTVDEGIVYTSLTGNVIDVNDALLRITGIPREELIGRNAVNLVRKLLSVKEITRVVPMVTQVIKGHSLAPFQLEYQNKVLEISAYFSAQSRNLIGTIRDITERTLAEEARRQAEESLRDSEDRYRDLVENSNDLISTHDLDGTLISINRAAQKITGYTRDELMKVNMADILDPKYRQLFRVS